MLVLTKKDLGFYTMMVGIIILSIVVPISVNKAKLETVTSSNLVTNRIIIDAGHGEPDGGAESANGIRESNLNLQIAKQLENVLKDNGYEVIMTRESEDNISGLPRDSGIRNLKVADTNKRIELINSSNAEYVISIHMNKFSDSKYSGWQTFYSKNSEEGKLLAECIQSGIGEETEIKNNRSTLKIEGIRIMEKTNIPVVIVECGFLSNEEECARLQDESYQNKIAEGILRGIEKYNSHTEARVRTN